MFTIPIKSTVQVDIKTPMKAYLTAQYPADEVARHERSLDKLQELRDQVVGIRSATQGNRQTLREYYPLIKAASAKFPIREGGGAGNNTSMKVGFSWGDILNNDERLTQFSWDYEMASIVYNLAAMETHFLASIPRKTPEEVQQTQRSLATAAGLLCMVRDELVPNLRGSSVPIDLTPQGLNMFINFLLAQEQVMWYEYAYYAKKTPHSLAKLATAAADKFRLTATVFPLNTPERAAVEKGYPWHVLFECFAMIYDAKSFMQYAEHILIQAEREQALYGHWVVWLTVAQNAIQATEKKVRDEVAKHEGLLQQYTQDVAKAKRGSPAAEAAARAAHAESGSLFMARQLLETVLPVVKNLSEQNEPELRRAEQLNTTLYKQRLPKIPDLERIQAHALGGATPPPSLTLADVGLQDSFASIIPAEISASLMTLPDRWALIFTPLQEKAEKATDEAKSTLSSLGLPGSLLTSGTSNGSNNGNNSNGGGVPAETWTRIERCQVQGGMDELDRIRASISKFSRETEDNLNRVEFALEDEIRADTEARQTFSHLKWQFSSASVATADLRDQLNQFKSHLAAAQASDSHVRGKLDMYRSPISGLSRPKQALDATIPTASSMGAANTSGNDALTSVVSTLKGAVAELTALLESRSKILSELKDGTGIFTRESIARALEGVSPEAHGKVLDEMISVGRSSNSASSSTATSSAAAATTSPTQLLDANLSSQQPLLERITLLNTRFHETRGLDETTRARDRAVQQLSEAVDRFEELYSNLKEGESFWTDFTGRTRRLLQETTDLIASREMARREAPLAGLRIPSNLGVSGRNLSTGGAGGGADMTGSISPTAVAMNMGALNLGGNMSPTANIGGGAGANNNGGAYSPWQYPAAPINTNGGGGGGAVGGGAGGGGAVPIALPPVSQQPPQYTPYQYSVPVAPPSYYNQQGGSGNNNPQPPSQYNQQQQQPFYQSYPTAPTPGSSSGAVGGGAGGGGGNQQDVSRLMELGFSRIQASRALEMHKGDFEAAMNQCLQEGTGV